MIYEYYTDTFFIYANGYTMARLTTYYSYIILIIHMTKQRKVNFAFIAVLTTVRFCWLLCQLITNSDGVWLSRRRRQADDGIRDERARNYKPFLV